MNNKLLKTSEKMDFASYYELSRKLRYFGKGYDGGRGPFRC